MKIAVVVSTYPPYRGGMGHVARDHAEALAKAGHEVTVLAPGVGLAPLFRVGNAACVPQLLWKLRGFDAVELHYPFFGGAEWVWLWRVLFGRRKRLAVLYHMDTVGRGALAAIFRLYRALFLKAILGSADVILVSSRDYLAASQAAAFLDDPRTREVPLAVDVDRFRPGAEKPEPLLLFVGALDRAHYFKGLGTLFEAFARVAASVPGARLAVVGDGELRQDYAREAARLGIHEKVWFVGRVTEEELPHCYRRARAFVLPSIDRSEAFGLVTIEAAASGTPAVVSDLPGARSTVEEGVTGLRVPPGDASALASAIEKLLSDPERSAMMGRAARERAVRLYSRDRIDRLVAETVTGQD